jgi:hypothetical protein
MGVHLYVTDVGADASEGARLLWRAVERAGSLAAIARTIDADRSYIGKWLRGKHKPGATFRGKLQSYGIPFSSWDSPAKKPFSLTAHAA